MIKERARTWREIKNEQLKTKNMYLCNIDLCTNKYKLYKSKYRIFVFEVGIFNPLNNSWNVTTKKIAEELEILFPKDIIYHEPT
jgi:hypothetical protein